MSLNYTDVKPTPTTPKADKIEDEYQQLKKEIRHHIHAVGLIRDKAIMTISELEAINRIADTYRNAIVNAYETGETEWGQKLETRMRANCRIEGALDIIRTHVKDMETIRAEQRETKANPQLPEETG